MLNAKTFSLLWVSGELPFLGSKKPFLLGLHMRRKWDSGLHRLLHEDPVSLRTAVSLSSWPTRPLRPPCPPHHNGGEGLMHEL